MRIIILIALLCNTAFSALYLNGATYTQTVTINHTSVSETNGHFLFQRKIPRTGSIALSVDSANDVGITRINDTTRIPRWVVFTTDTIYLYADIAVSSTVDTSYRIQYGKALNEVNASATFTNCGVTNYVGANSTAQDATVLNYVTSENLVVTSTAITGSQGLFSNGLEFFGTSDGKVTFGSEMVGTGDITISAMVKRKSTAQTYQYILYNGAFELYFQTSSGDLYIHNSNTTFKQVSAALPALDVWYFLVVRISSAGLCQVFINGSAVGVSSSSGPRATGPSSAYIGAKNAAYRLSSYVDEFMTRNVLATSSAIVDRYNMIFTPTTFSTLGAVEGIPITPNQHIDTLKLVCSALNAITWQWYQNDTAKVGETDSVLTIYADSAFYASKNVFYCLVNGTTKSQVWRFGFYDMLLRRWDGFKKSIKDAFKSVWK